MSGAANSKRSQENAAHLLKKGIWHGRRMTTPHHNNIPVNATGSAAYRRLQAKKLGTSYVYGRAGDTT